MNLISLRDRIVCALGGASLLEGVSQTETQQAFGGRMPAQAATIGAVAPWSARGIR